jgi:soluble lytic murein transglycosylase-like protein
MRDEGFYDGFAASAAARHGVPVSWIKAVIGTETSFEIPAPRRWEPKVQEYAYGPMQILLSTADQLYPGISAAELESADANVDVGAAYIRRLMDSYGGDFRDVYSAYNSGNPERWHDPSSPTAANVTRALGWLDRFMPAETVAPAATLNAGVSAGTLAAEIGGLALWIFWKRRKP